MKGSRGQRAADGFTLVELLVVVIIIGILGAIAIPTYLRQQERANIASATSDLRNTVLAIESWSGEPGHDLADLDGATQASPILATEGLRVGTWVKLSITASGSRYCVVGRHDLVKGRELRFDTDTGIVEIGPMGTLPC